MENVSEQINIVRREIARYKELYQNERDEIKSIFAKQIAIDLEKQLDQLLALEGDKNAEKHRR